MKEGQQRQYHTTYFYIDFCSTIDSIKWRMHQLVKTVEDRMRNVSSFFNWAFFHKRFTILFPSFCLVFYPLLLRISYYRHFH